MTMTWEEFCRSKKIDPKLFLEQDAARYHELKVIFEQVHPKSFTEQKKFLINDLRRRYLLKEEAKTEATVKTAKPGVKIPPRVKKDDPAG